MPHLRQHTYIFLINGRWTRSRKLLEARRQPSPACSYPRRCPAGLATAARCQEQLRACGGGSRRAWWPCCGGARVWVRSLSPTPTRRPSFRGVVLRSVLTPCPPSRNGRGSRGSAALPQRTGAQQPLEEVVWRNAPEFPEGQITTTVVRPALVPPCSRLPSSPLIALISETSHAWVDRLTYGHPL